MSRKTDYSKLTDKRRVVSVTIEFIAETDESDLDSTMATFIALKRIPNLGCLPVPAKVSANVLWDRSFTPEQNALVTRGRRRG